MALSCVSPLLLFPSAFRVAISCHHSLPFQETHLQRQILSSSTTYIASLSLSFARRIHRKERNCTCVMMDKCILSFFVLILYFLCGTAIPSTDRAPLAPALYVFGDSLFDSGNNNLLPTIAKANFPPYGVNFAGGPTGRFTNGRTVADFIAEFLRLPLAPPYLGFRVSPYVSATGMNYASGSCGILHETGKFIGECLSLGEQIDLFQTTIELKLPRYHKSSGDFSSYMSKSVFIISIGSNDYINNYLLPGLGIMKHYSPQSFASLLVNNLAQHLQRLYELGVRKMLVFEIGPIGCIPSLARTTDHRGQCVEEINQLAILFNHQLDAMLKTLSSVLPGSELIFGRIHRLAYDAIRNPSKYGLKDTSNPCCITWANGTSACIPALAPCVNPDKHFFWDGYHLTEAVYGIVGGRCIHDSSICTPKNIKQLITV